MRAKIVIGNQRIWQKFSATDQVRDHAAGVVRNPRSFSRTPEKKGDPPGFLENNPSSTSRKSRTRINNSRSKLCAGKRQSYSLCDAVSFVVSNAWLKQALAFDEHFRQFGEFEIIS